MPFTHNDIEFLIAPRLEEEFLNFSDSSNTMSYADGLSAPGGFLYSNLINYIQYDPVQWDIDDGVDGDDGNVDVYTELEFDAWNMQKLNTPHPVLFPGEPSSFAQRVFGLPMGLYNPTDSPIDYYLQFFHSSAVEFSITDINIATSVMSLNITFGEFKVLDDTLPVSSYVGQKVVVSRQQSSSESSAQLIDPNNPIIPIVNTVVITHEDTVNQLNPVAYWKMDDLFILSLAVDETGNYNGTYVNGPILDTLGLLTDDVNAATKFDVVENTYMKVSNSGSIVQTGSPFSISMLVNRSQEHGVNISALASLVTDGEDFAVFDGSSIAGYGQFSFGSGSTWVSLGSDDIFISNGTTYHVTITYNGTSPSAPENFKLYVDGVELTLSAISSLPSNTTLDTQVGRLSDEDIFGFNGTIDDVSIFPSELTSLEVINLLNSSKGLPHLENLLGDSGTSYSTLIPLLSPISYWKLNELSGTTAFDSIGSNNGTHVGTPVLGVDGLLVNDVSTAIAFNRIDTESITLGEVLPINIGDTISISALIKPSITAGSVLNTIFARMSAANDGYSFEVMEDGALRILIRQTSGTNELDIETSAGLINIGNTYHVVLTLDGTGSAAGTQLYINGEIQTKVVFDDSWTISPVYTGMQCRIGGRDSGYEWNGTLDEIAILDKVLDQSEVTSLYNYAVDGTEFKSTSAETDYFIASTALTPLAYYRLSDNTGPLVDEMGIAYGVYSASVTRSAQGLLLLDDNKSVRFNRATNDYARVTRTASLDNLFTGGGSLSFLVKPTIGVMGAGANSGRVIDYDSPTSDGYGWLLQEDDFGILKFTIRGLGTYSSWDIGSVTEGIINHFVLVFDSGLVANNPTCYLNGELTTVINTIRAASYGVDTNNVLTIGNNDVASRSYDGIIDEVTLYSDILSSGEVLDLYQTSIQYIAPAPTGYLKALLALNPTHLYRQGEEAGPSMIDYQGVLNRTYFSSVVFGADGLISGSTDTCATYDGNIGNKINLYAQSTTAPLYTMAFIIKTTNDTAVYAYGYYGGTHMYLRISGGKMQMTTTYHGSITSVNRVDDGKPHHIVWDHYYNGGYRLYVDGVYVGTIGTYAYYGLDMFQQIYGQLDEWAMWTSAPLSSAQIGTLYRSTVDPGSYRNLVYKLLPSEYWRLGEDQTADTFALNEFSSSVDYTWHSSTLLEQPGLLINDPLDDNFCVKYTGNTSQHILFYSQSTAAEVYSVTFVFSATVSSEFMYGYYGGTHMYIGINGNGNMYVSTSYHGSITSGINVTDGQPHILVLNHPSSGQFQPYVDGVSFGTINTYGSYGLDMFRSTNGYVDELAQFKGRILSIAEIGSLSTAFTNGTDYETAILALNPSRYWRMSTYHTLPPNRMISEIGRRDGTYLGGVTRALGALDPQNSDGNQSVVLDGIDGAIETDFYVNADASMSVTCIIKITDFTNSFTIFGDASAMGLNSTTRLMLSIHNNGNWYPSIGNNSSSWLDINSNKHNLELNRVYHIGYTVNSTDVRIYVDGALAASYISTVALGTAGTHKFSIGRLGELNGMYFPGSIDEVTVFRQTIGGTQMAELGSKGAELAPEPFGYSKEVLDLLPVAYYRFGEIDLTVAADETGNYDATYEGSPSQGELSTVAGDANASIRFDGTGDSVNLLPLLQQVKTHTTGSVAFLTRISGSDSVFIGLGYSGSDDYSSTLSVSATDMSAYIATNTSYDSITRASIDGIGVHHCVFVQDDIAGCLLYLDGILLNPDLATSGNYTGAWIGNNTNIDSMYVNRLTKLTSIYYPGSIDELAFYDFALTPDQISNMYDISVGEGKPPATGYALMVETIAPIAYYRLGDKPPLSVDDNFNGNNSQPLNKDFWSYELGTTPKIYQNAYRTLDASVTVSESHANSVYGITGSEIDIQFDFTLNSSLPPTATDHELQLYIETDNHIITNKVFQDATGTYYGFYLHDIGGILINSGTVLTANTSGKLRVLITPTSIKFFTWSGTQWEWDANISGHVESVATGKVDFVRCSIIKGDNSIDWQIDNYVLNSGIILQFVAEDEIGSYNGTYRGLPNIYETGLIVNDVNGSVNFDGIDDHVEIDNLIPEILTHNQGSIAFLFSIGAGETAIISATDDTVEDRYIEFSISDTIILYSFRDSGSSQGPNNFKVGYTTSVGLNVSNHIVFVHDSVSGCAIYLNGSKLTINYIAGTPGDKWFSSLVNLNKFSISSSQKLTPSFKSAIIDDVSIFDVDITEFNVQQLYYTAISVKVPDAPPITGYDNIVNNLSPVAYWRLGETNPPLIINDLFSGIDEDLPDITLWQNTSDLVIRSNRLVANTINTNAILESIYGLSGDFDIEIDAIVGTYDASDVIDFIVYDPINPDNYIRIRIGDVVDSLTMYDIVDGVFENQPTQTFTNNGTISLKITRVGNTFQTFWDDGTAGWESAGSKIVSISNTLSIRLIIQTNLIDDYSINRFGVNSGTISTVVINDETGTYNGVYSGVPTLESEGLLVGDYNKSVNFDGVNDYGFFGEILPVVRTSPISFSFNINLDDMTNTARIISRLSAGNVGYVIDINPDGSLRVLIRHTPVSDEMDIYTTAGLIELNNNYNIVVSTDGVLSGGVNIYINGIEHSIIVVTDSWTTDIDFNGINFNIGASSATSSSFVNGIIDDVAIFDYKLTQLQAIDLYNGSIAYIPGAGLYLNYPDAVIDLLPTAYWRFGETFAADGIMLDEGGTYNGTYTGAPGLEDTRLLVDVPGYSVRFDGINDSVSVSTSDVGTTWTISVVISVRDISSDGYLFSNESGTGLYIDTLGKLTWKDTNTTSFQTVLSTGVVTSIAVVSNNGIINCYFDGILDAITITASQLAGDNFYPFHIGSDGNQSNWYAGGMDGLMWLESSIDITIASDLTNAAKGLPPAIFVFDNYEVAVNSLNPVAYWRLGETTGIIAVDETGNNNAAYTGSVTLDQPPLLLNEVNRSVNLNTIGAKVDTFSVATGPNHTITCIINLESVTDYQDIITGTGIGIGLSVWNTGRLIWTTGSSGAVSDILEVGVSYHCAVVISGTNATLYVNGREVSTYANGAPITYTHIGENTSSRELKGFIDEVAIFDTALTAGQIGSLYNTSIKGSPSYETVLVLDSITGLTSASTGTIPSIEVNAAMKEYEATIVSISEDGLSLDIHIDEAYSIEELEKTSFLSPFNQEIRILPLGNGIYIPPVNPLTSSGSLSGDTFIDVPTDHSLVSWVYNTNESSMSDPGKLSTPLLKFSLQPGEVYKFMIVSWKDEDTSLFYNGFYTRIFG
ncbi:hypothetical protein N9242_00865 [Vicingaceae bacterium]|nr:hypothetical protein [Vicingaceae bacterium]